MTRIEFQVTGSPVYFIDDETVDVGDDLHDLPTRDLDAGTVDSQRAGIYDELDIGGEVVGDVPVGGHYASAVADVVDALVEHPALIHELSIDGDLAAAEKRLHVSPRRRESA